MRRSACTLYELGEMLGADVLLEVPVIDPDGDGRHLGLPAYMADQHDRLCHRFSRLSRRTGIW